MCFLAVLSQSKHEQCKLLPECSKDSEDVIRTNEHFCFLGGGFSFFFLFFFPSHCEDVELYSCSNSAPDLGTRAVLFLWL